MQGSRAVRLAGRACLCAMLFALATGAFAQRVYKQVGPDGKVTFSDAPPPDKESVLLRGSTLQPSTELFPAGSGGSGNINRQLQHSVTTMYMREFLVNAFQQACNSAPNSGKYNNAADGWRMRHARLIAQRESVFRESMTADQRTYVETVARTQTARVTDSAMRASPSRRTAWCEANADDLNSGRLDSANDASVAAPLTNYRFR